MNPVTKAVDDVKFRIPMEILKEVFGARDYGWRASAISIDEQMLALVIRPRVLVDCNLVGGSEVVIPLDGLKAETTDQFPNIFRTVFRIPKSLTDGRSITSVLSVGFATVFSQGSINAMSGINQNSTSAVGLSGMALLNSYSAIPVSSTAKVRLIAENTIMVSDVTPLMSSAYLRCVIANDENLAHIQMRSYQAFSKLVELAIKSFIYVNLAIKISQAQLSGGQELGKFKEIVDGYSDSEDMYQEYLKKNWEAVAFMNDSETFTRNLKLRVGALR